MSLSQSFPDDVVDDDEDTAELDDSAGDSDEFDMPDDPPIVPGGRDNALIPGADGTEDDVHTNGRPMTDDEITARVLRLLRSDSATSMLRIHVRTEDGVVTLRGSVETLDDTDNAAEVASRVSGVIDVVDELDVEL